MHIRSLNPADLPMLARHKTRHSKENGRDGDLIFAPTEEEFPIKDEDLKRDAEALVKSVATPGWIRVWILTDENEVYGDLTLAHRPAMKAALHRCLMMMGLERSSRNQGWGSKLIRAATDWAKQESALEWVTLFVFENNPPAKSLYKKFGFETVGTTKDMFRVFGQSIDDTEMVLKLR
jgi:ribosomal protein S18 acetylase RimI-like enzyme